MTASEKPKRVIDRERQWRKVDAGHYTSPKGRFDAVRAADGWTLVDGTGELEVEFFTRWKDARAYTDAIEFGNGTTTPSFIAPIEFIEDEIRDEFHDVYRVTAVRDGVELFEVVARRGEIVTPQLDTFTVDEAQALATALMLAVHNGGEA